jgi:hypothetical protein
MHFTEIDFLEKLPFLIEKDPELVKQAGWLTTFSRQLNNAIAERNHHIELAQLASQQGGLTVYQLDSAIHLQNSVGAASCLTALQLFKIFLATAEKLRAISNSYNAAGKKSKIMPPKSLDETMAQLKQIVGDTDLVVET